MPENESFEREVLDRLKTIEVKIDNYDKIKEQVYQNQRDILSMKHKSDTQDEQLIEKISYQDCQLRELKDNNKWLIRTIVAEIITIVIGVIAAVIGMGVGM